MTGKKNLALTLALAAAGMAWQGSAGATELWDNQLAGFNEGLAGGALPPAGVYGVWDQYWASYHIYDNNANATATGLDALVEVPIVLWVPGIELWGGQYAAAVALPFDYTNVKAPGAAGLANNGHLGTFNTIIDPILVSWALPNDLHVKAGLGIAIDDASSSPAHPPTNGGVGSGNGFNSLLPSLAVSWLHDGWNISVDGQYGYNFTDTKTQYRSGSELTVNYTATKQIGNWGVGVGAYTVNQLTADSGNGAAACASTGGCKAVNYGLGPLVSYQIGSVNVLAEYNHAMYTKNDVGGNLFNVRLIFPIS